MYLCYEVVAFSLSQVVEVFDLASYPSVGSTIRKIRLTIEHDELLRSIIDLIKLDLTP